MTVAAAIETLAGGRSETGSGQVRAGTPGKVQSSPWAGSIPSSSTAVAAQTFRSSFLATMDAAGDRAIEEEAGTEDRGAEKQAQIEVPAGKALENVSTLGVGTTASVPATPMQSTHSIIGRQGSTSASSGARIPASKPASTQVSQGTVEHDAKSSMKARPGESVHDAQPEHPGAALAFEPPPMSTGVASLALPTPILARPEALAQSPDDSGASSNAMPIPVFGDADARGRQFGDSGIASPRNLPPVAAETDVPTQQPDASPIGSPSTTDPSDTELVASVDIPAVSQLHGSAPHSESSAAPVAVPAGDSWVRASEASGQNSGGGAELSQGLLAVAAQANSVPDSVSDIQYSPSSVGATSGRPSIQSLPSASANSEIGAHLHESASYPALKQVPVQTPDLANPHSQIPNPARSKIETSQVSSMPGASSQLSGAQRTTEQWHTPHPAVPVSASVVPAMANTNPVPGPANYDPMQPVPALSASGTQAIESALPAMRSASAGSPRISAETPSKATRWANGVEGATQVGSVHPAQPGAAAQDGPVLAPVRDPAAIGATANQGSGSPSATPNSSESPSDAFATIDAGIATGSHTWVHAGAQRAEAGFEDPDLGWIGVRADTSGGGIHAALIPGSADASQMLGGHMADLHTYLTDRHTQVDTLTLADLDSRSAGSGTGRQGSEGMQQGAGQNDGRGANPGAQAGTQASARAVAATVSAEPRPQPASQDSSYDMQRPGGTHISVMA